MASIRTELSYDQDAALMALVEEQAAEGDALSIIEEIEELTGMPFWAVLWHLRNKLREG